MSKQIRWLHKEIGSWQAEQLISPQQAEQIRARYAVSATSRSWDRLIFPSIGAVVFGLGIILLFAYNWADMHRYLKLAIVFGSLLTAHGLGYYLSSPQRPQRGLGEGLHLLGTMLFGAGIWLIAQIYHLDEHYPNAFLAWGLGALAFAWVLPSVAQGLLAVVLLSLWSGMEIIDFRQVLHASWLLILLGVLPLAWWLRSPLLMFTSLLSFSVLLVYNLTVPFPELMIYLGFSLACFYLALAKLAQSTGFPESATILNIIGFAGYLLILYLFSFKLSGYYLAQLHDAHLLGWVNWIVPLLMMFSAWLTVLLGKNWSLLSRLDRWQSCLIMIVMLLVTVHFFMPIQRHNDWIYTLLFNLVYLSHCVIFIIQGIQQVSWKQVSIGCVLMALLLFVRFTDLFGSLLVRALMFVLLGIGLFAVGYFYSRRKQQEIADA
jgi:uncharacterized membrane protein